MKFYIQLILHWEMETVPYSGFGQVSYKIGGFFE